MIEPWEIGNAQTFANGMIVGIEPAANQQKWW